MGKARDRGNSSSTAPKLLLPSQSTSFNRLQCSPQHPQLRLGAIENQRPVTMADNNDNDGSSQKGAATERLAQVSNHLSSPNAANDKKPRSSSSRRRHRRNKPANDLPADYADILAHLSTLHTLANTPDPSHRGYARQTASGKLWVRERVAQLLDRDSFREVGSASGEVAWQQDPQNTLRETPASFTPSNNVQGFGALRGRKILFTADDFSLRAGHADGALAAKTVYMEKLALALRLPMVKLVDGSSGGGSVTSIRKEGWSYVPPMQGFGEVVQQLNAGIPNLGAVLGPAIGLGAARVTACHFSVMARDVGALFNAGPKVVAGEFCCASRGAVHC